MSMKTDCFSSHVFLSFLQNCRMNPVTFCRSCHFPHEISRFFRILCLVGMVNDPIRDASRSALCWNDRPQLVILIE